MSRIMRYIIVLMVVIGATDSLRAQQSLYRIRLQDAFSHSLTVDGPSSGFGATWTLRLPSNVSSIGSILYSSDAAGQLSWLSAGSNTQVLTLVGGVPTWAAPATSGTVTSVGLSMPTGFSVANSPITSGGTLAVTTSLNGVIHGNGSGFTASNVDLTSEVTGLLPPANGGTGLNTSATTKGSLLYTSAIGTWGTLAAGSSAQVLTIVSGVPKWVAPATSGTVTSIGLTVPSILSVTPATITSSGTFAVTLATQTANTVFAGPASGGAAAPTFRALTSSDIPSLAYVTSVGLSMPTGFSVGSSPITSSGTLAVTTTLNGVIHGNGSGFTAGNVNLASEVTGLLPPANGGTGLNTSATTLGSLLYTSAAGTWSTLSAGSNTQVLTLASGVPTWATPTTGTITSVGLALPSSEFTVTNSPVTSSGTLTGAWKNQTQNLVFASPSGSTGTPTFRALTSSDIPSLSYVTSVGLSMPSIFTVTNSPVTTSGTLTAALATQNKNLVFAGPASGSAAAPTFRALVAADLDGTSWTLKGNSSTTPWNGTTGNFLGTTDSKSVVFATGSTARMTLDDPTGFIAVGGTFTPTAPLHIRNSNPGHAVIFIENTAATGYTSIDFSNNATPTPTIGNMGVSNTGSNVFPNQYYFNISSGTILPITFNQNTNEKMAVDVNGNVYVVNNLGLGFNAGTYATIASAGRTLNVAGTAGTVNVRMSSLGAATPSATGGVIYADANGDLNRLSAPGTSGQVLSSTTGGTMTWINSTSGSVTSVGLTMPSIFSVTNSPVTSTGSLTATLTSQSANLVFAAPNGAAGTPTFRALVASDIPDLSSVYIENQTTLQSSSNFHISGNGKIEGSLQLKGTAAGTTSITAGAQGATNISYTLPTAVPSTSGQVLASTTGGTMSWSSVPLASMSRGRVAASGALTQAISDAAVTSTSSITVTYEDAGAVVPMSISARSAGTSFTVKFSAAPSTSGFINYVIIP